jgi:hypothetical protein
MDHDRQLEPATARKVFLRQMTLLAILLAAAAMSNAFTAIANAARDGIHLPAWEPAVDEFSSELCLWLLIPAVGWWLRQFPLIRPDWPRSLPAHLLATLPFSPDPRGRHGCPARSRVPARRRPLPLRSLVA